MNLSIKISRAAARLFHDTDNLFAVRNFNTWFMYALIAGEIGGMCVILWGFITTQLLER